MAEWGIGSFLNVPSSGSPNVTQWQALMESLQQVATTNGPKLPVIYGLDSVHGANYVLGSVMFPQSLALAATFNTSAASVFGEVTAKDTRAADVPWAFSPILGLMSQPIWVRTRPHTTAHIPRMHARIAHATVCNKPIAREEHHARCLPPSQLLAPMWRVRCVRRPAPHLLRTYPPPCARVSFAREPCSPACMRRWVRIRTWRPKWRAT
ncbi:MAG: hypothetical protein EOO39_21325 [Cytophagaceae bacterium]|nr:MAG: hypothetical protein EOO39_21325 [Cytophagaceae bacterium]